MKNNRDIRKQIGQGKVKIDLIDVAEKMGFVVGGKAVLTKQNCIQLREELGKMKRLFANMAEKGGYVVVNDNGCDITAYRLDSYINKSAFNDVLF